ncbi:MAG TPA: glycosyltransferase family 4 protein [Myxococcota bacterium]|nr:glycosyltransferase family 4 protein [Myxococcota bacterium]
MSPLRIAFVAYRGNMRCGGQGVYLWFLARELARLGHRVDVWVGPPYPDPMPFAHSVNPLRNHQYWGKWFSKDRRALIPQPRTRLLNPLEFYELGASYLGFLPEPLAFSVRALLAIAAQLRAGERYDVVHDVQCLGFGLLGLRALGLPVVSTVHHPLTVDRRSSFLRDTNLREAIGTMAFYPVGMQSFVARRIDRLFTSSAASARQIERDFGVARERIRMVANGVDTDLFSPDLAVQRDPHEVLCVGRASDPNKGVPTLVEAIAKLPRPVRLTLVDDPHPDNPARKRARALGIEDRIDVVGRVEVETLVGLYRRAALVAVPSLFEGFGLPAAEAMACGTPVVATAAGSLPEVIGTAGGGILARAHSADALARGIAELLAQPAARADLGAQGRKGVVAAYSWPSVARRTAEVYAEVYAELSADERRGRPASTTTSAPSGHPRAIASSARSSH